MMMSKRTTLGKNMGVGWVHSCPGRCATTCATELSLGCPPMNSGKDATSAYSALLWLISLTITQLQARRMAPTA